MLKIEQNGNTLELYASAKEMPITRRQALQKWILHDSGIGSDMESVDKRLANVLVFATNAKFEEMKGEVLNLRYTLFSMLQGIDYKSRAFACFVSKINGEQVNDISDDGLKETARKLGELQFTFEEIDSWFEEVKKKLIPN